MTTNGNFEKMEEAKQERQTEVHRRFEEQKEELVRRATADLQNRFVKAGPPEGAIVEREEAEQLVRKFRSLLREGKLLESFACGALLDPEKGVWDALKSMSYEYRGTKQATAADREVHVQAGRSWAAVSLRVDSGQGGAPDYPMYLVVATSEGPRIVVDIGLRLATNKGREVLNGRVWKRVEAQLGEKESALVRSLFEGHVERSKSDLAEWVKTNKSK